MPKTEYDLRAIMYTAFGTHHILCSISGNKNQLTRYPLVKDRQSKVSVQRPHLAWLKQGAGYQSPLLDCFLVRGRPLAGVRRP